MAFYLFKKECNYEVRCQKGSKYFENKHEIFKIYNVKLNASTNLKNYLIVQSAIENNFSLSLINVKHAAIWLH